VIPLHPGVGILLPPGAGHEYRACEDMRVYNCLFRAELMDAELMWARRDRLLGPLFDPGRSAAGGLPRTYVELDPTGTQRILEALEPIRTGEASTRAAQLARLLLALEVIATVHAEAHREEAGSSASPMVADAIDLMTADLSFPWTLDDLSQRMFVGRFHLARTFARWVGQPPMHYLARLRAERAAALLATTDLPVAVIGTKVGWPDPAYFSRRFRAAFGVSPRAYRTLRSAGLPGDAVLGKDVQEHGKRGQVAV
jgi:AraC family L-rhamnose operon transcriptional activator RhaR